MTDISELNQAAQTMGARFINLKTVADGPVEGTVLAFEQRPMTFEGAPVYKQGTQQQRTEWVFTLQCTPDPTDLADDGIRRLSLKERAQTAVTAAIKETGVKATTGATLKLGVVTDRTDDRSQPDYQARWTPAPTTLGVPGGALEDEEPF